MLGMIVPESDLGWMTLQKTDDVLLEQQRKIDRTIEP